jgi:choline dehydrogenase
MRSGVGPADHLRDFGIDVLQDLPVGCGLNEHPSIELELLLKEPAAKVTDKYALSCLVRFSSGLAGAGPNDMGFGSFNLFDPGEGDRAQGTILLTLFRSFSRGSIRLRSTRPDIDPAIEFNMLSDDRDIGRMCDGVRRLLELASHSAVKSIASEASIGGVRSERELPQDLRPWLLQVCDTIGHPCGSARMGAVTDPRAVLDSRCRVLGLESLRVADASSLPSTPRANNHLTCVMLAEHVAQQIESDRQNHTASAL